MGPCSSWGKLYGSTSLRDDPKSWRGARERADPWRKAEGIKSSEPRGCRGTGRIGGDGTVLRGGISTPKSALCAGGSSPQREQGGRKPVLAEGSPKQGEFLPRAVYFPYFCAFPSWLIGIQTQLARLPLTNPARRHRDTTGHGGDTCRGTKPPGARQAPTTEPGEMTLPEPLCPPKLPHHGEIQPPAAAFDCHHPHPHPSHRSDASLSAVSSPSLINRP